MQACTQAVKNAHSVHGKSNSLEIELLGYVVSDKGVSMSKSRPNMILDWPEPWSIKDSQQLIGFASFLPSSYPQVLEDRDRHGQHATGGKEQPEESPQVGHAN